MANQNLRVIFTDKAESVFSDILKNYALEESQEEDFARLKKGEPSKTNIIRKIIDGFAAKIITREDFDDLLLKILKTGHRDTKTISDDILENLIPLLQIFPEEKFNDPNFREEISKKLFPDDNRLKPQINVDKIFAPSIKKIEFPNVKENAEQMNKEKKRVISEEQETKHQEEYKGEDKYREPIE